MSAPDPMWTVEDHHLQWRPLTRDDVSELDALRDQIEAFDDAVLTSAERAFSSADVDLEGAAVGGWDAYGNLLAFGWNLPEVRDDGVHVHMLGGVHPSHRHLGLGGALVSWHLRHAAALRDRSWPGRPVWSECHAEERNVALRRLLAEEGFQPVRWFVDMYRPLPLGHDPGPVPGAELVPFSAEHALPLMQLHAECFAVPGRSLDSERWLRSLEREHFRPAWSWVAFAEGRIVGYALSGVDDAAVLDGVTEGWTDRLGVHPDYRGRGIGTALLERSLASMTDAGCPGAGIGVDTSEPGFADYLHQRLHYEVRDSLELWSRELKDQ